MKISPSRTCPRCGDDIGPGMGSLSRADNDSEVCSERGGVGPIPGAGDHRGGVHHHRPGRRAPRVGAPLPVEGRIEALSR